MYVDIFIYIEREREREGEADPVARLLSSERERRERERGREGERERGCPDGCTAEMSCELPEEAVKFLSLFSPCYLPLYMFPFLGLLFSQLSYQN